MEKKVLFSEMINGNSRTYFIDVKEASNGSPYLTICESKKSKEKEGEYERVRLIVFQNDSEAFAKVLAKASEHMADKAEAEAAVA